jgi:DNA-binding IclR family transcriptional regulator
MVTFTEYIDILEALATAPGGLTAGQIRRQADINFDTQKITRALKSLEREALVYSFRVAYRPNVLKVVWHVSSTAVAYCRSVQSAYDANELSAPRLSHADAEEDGDDDIPF